MKKIVVKVHMNCSKCKGKAMQKAAIAPGVSSVAIDGDKVVVMGDEVDVLELTKSLKKKFGFAAIESVQEVKKDDKKEKKEEVQFLSGYVVNPHFPVHCYQVPCYDEPNPSFCSIL